jgi:hypothetical protein
MRVFVSSLLALALGAAVLVAMSAQSAVPHSWLIPLRDDAGRLIRAATEDDFAWRRLAELTDTHGSRLSGSDNLARAIDWAIRTMKADGLENVHTERVMVPRWVRGRRVRSSWIHRAATSRFWVWAAPSARHQQGSRRKSSVVSSFDDLRGKGGRCSRTHRAVQRAVLWLLRDRSRIALTARVPRLSMERSVCSCDRSGRLG